MITFEMVLQLVLTLLGSTTLIIFNRLSKDVHELMVSTRRLNEKMVGVVVKVDGHEKRLDRIERDGPNRR